MMTSLSAALSRVAIWAIHEPTLAALVRAATERADVSASPPAVVQASAMDGVSMVAPPTVAVIPIRGVIEPRRSYWSEHGFGTSIEGLRASLRRALADESVKGIVFDINSPGGDATGVEEFANDVFRARGLKPMIAVCNSFAASAAYWIATQADEVVGLQVAGSCGSIGVFSMHFDQSRLLADLGVAVTIIKAGAYKTEGNPFEPLSDEGRAFLQAQIDHIYGRFVAAVARGRGVSPAVVKAEFGQGRCYMLAQAVAAGMADRMGTFDEVIAKAAAGRVARRGAAAESHERFLSVSADGASEPPAPVEPNDDGECEDGYELGEDGLCHLVAGGRALHDGAADDATPTSAELEAVRRDLDWLETV